MAHMIVEAIVATIDSLFVVEVVEQLLSALASDSREPGIQTLDDPSYFKVS